ncbi:MAG: phosphatidylserine decarboxylase family protein, partial [Mycobacteriaceae bacterium]|nr:phosphatidylserine decarboxylase family protein [Mycobacteriaceae bacterium]
MARRPRLPADDPESEASRLIELIRSTVPPMHPAGIPFVSAGLAVAAAGRRHRWIRTAGLSAAGACALFFRHPARVPPERSGVVVSPADGQVTIIDTAVPPAELGLADEPVPRVSVFLSLFDVHVQRVPVG